MTLFKPRLEELRNSALEYIKNYLDKYKEEVFLEPIKDDFVSIYRMEKEGKEYKIWAYWFATEEYDSQLLEDVTINRLCSIADTLRNILVKQITE